eukprot:5595413-Pyramimonas_sp.AAC.1
MHGEATHPASTSASAVYFFLFPAWYAHAGLRNAPPGASCGPREDPNGGPPSPAMLHGKPRKPSDLVRMAS